MDISVDESPAVQALGLLFKLTEVHLWDDGSSEVRESPYSREPIELINSDKDYEKSDYARINGLCSLTEDEELAKNLNDLGLPLSFHTNREKRYGMTSGKRKGTRKKNQQSSNEIDDCMLYSVKESEESRSHGIVADVDGLSHLSLERGDSLGPTACTNTLSVMDRDTEGQSNNVSFEVVKDSDVASFAQLSEQDNSNMIDNHQTDDSGEWIAYWDDFYMRTYFYNVKTEESTWDPPSGMEHLAYSDLADKPPNIVDGLSELEHEQMDLRRSEEDNGSSQQLDEITGMWLSSDNVSSTTTTKRKKKVRRTKSDRKLSVSSEDLQGVLQEVPSSIGKYWCQRYILFSRFDCGIKMDEEGWFSVTPEPIAKHHAVRCGNGTIVDFFTGVGGNAIQLAQRSKRVIAIDIDPNKIDYAWHNAAIYGVSDNIDFIKGDSFSLAPKLKADTVFMSPPWGGPAYSKVKKFDIKTMLKPHDGQFLFNAGKGIAPKIVMFLPRNVDVNQLAELSLSVAPPWSLEVERNFLNGRLKAVTAYFSEPSMSSID